MLRELGALTGTGRVTAVRGRGLWAGIDIAPAVPVVSEEDLD